MAAHKVIVFGPTGAVGSSAARTASQLGAKVVLAMRDTSKSIPDLDAETERQAGFERVQADLTKPDSVREAIQKTGATRAFFYLAHGMPNGMQPTVEALHAAGIELPVFLSSFTIQTDLETIPPEEAIPYIHAQVELRLEQAFGKDGFFAARPGSFASNTRGYRRGLQDGTVPLFAPNGMVDCIVPEDIGRVCGTVLARGMPSDGTKRPYLYGPEILSNEQTVDILAKVLGKEVKIQKATADETYRVFVKERKIPEAITKYLLSREVASTSEGLQSAGYAVTKDQLTNVEKYSGRKGTTFEEWAQKNKHLFA